MEPLNRRILEENIFKTLMYLSIGVVIGAQVGARLSTRISGSWIIRGLAIALGFVGIRILFLAFEAMSR